MDHFLITGGAGFIGSALARHFAKKPNTRVTVVDDFRSGHWRNLLDCNCVVRATSCTDPQLLKEIESGVYTAIFHQAAITDTTVMDQRTMLEINTNAFEALLRATAASETRIVYASSAGVYGNTPAPNRVGHGEVPENIYGFSKLAMDRMARQWFDLHPRPIVGLRYFNVFGPGEQHKGSTASMIYQLYGQIKKGQNPRLFKYGEQRRDFVYIQDVIYANEAALSAPRSGICNVGTGQSRSFNDIVQTLEHILHRTLEVDYIDNPFPFFQRHTEACLEESTRLLGWRPQWSTEEGIFEYVRWLESHPEVQG